MQSEAYAHLEVPSAGTTARPPPEFGKPDVPPNEGPYQSHDLLAGLCGGKSRMECNQTQKLFEMIEVSISVQQRMPVL